MLCFLIWYFYLKPKLLLQITAFERMYYLQNAFGYYYSKYNRMPTNLFEVVKAGILPEKGIIFSSPVIRYSFRGENIYYTNCEYDITYYTNRITIRIPDYIFDTKKYMLYKNNRRNYDLDATPVYEYYGDFVYPDELGNTD